MKRSLSLIALGLGLIGPMGAGAADVPRVKIDTGALSGSMIDGAAVYKAIPYAAPPVGDLRWAAPKAAIAWPGTRDATQFGKICPQPMAGKGETNAGGASGASGEDCLFANIWAPPAAKNAPVMLWLHGGGNTTGAGSLGPYDGTAFARDGVILVTINYRLGAFGFFAHPALTKAAGPNEALINYGLLDQIAALKWVKRNISAFGGDPSRVTVFGESAGGADTLMLLSTPKAKGLFAGAIVESGGGWTPPVTLTKREADGVALAKRAGAPADASLAQLRALSAEQIVASQTGEAGVGIDGRLLTQTPAQAFARGQQLHVPLIIGSNSYEASLMKSVGTSAATYLAGTPDTLKAAYADEPSDQAKADAIFTDAVMGAPAHWLASRAARSGQSVWLYHFPYVLSLQRGFLKGAPHAFEIPYVFDSWPHLGALAMGFKPDAEAMAVTTMVHSCWISFAKTGMPACGEGQAWPAYTLANDTLIRFDAKPSLVSHFRQTQYQAQGVAKLPALDVDAR